MCLAHKPLRLHLAHRGRQGHGATVSTFVFTACSLKFRSCTQGRSVCGGPEFASDDAEVRRTHILHCISARARVKTVITLSQLLSDSFRQVRPVRLALSAMPLSSCAPF